MKYRALSGENQMLSKIENAVRKAGVHLLEGFEGAKNVTSKGKADLVTQYDVEVEKILFSELSFMLPEYTFMAEETASARPENKKAVIIDPIDGTTNFVHGFPFCCISVGVYNGLEGLYGVVYNPVTGEMFKAEKGCGAYLNNEKIFVSQKNTLEESLIATGFPYSIVEQNPEKILAVLRSVLEQTRGIRRAGSAALDLCYTAKGVFDAYYEFNLKPWDIAGGSIIALESGAVLSSGSKNHPVNIYENFILASSPGIFGKLFEIVLH